MIRNSKKWMEALKAMMLNKGYKGHHSAPVLTSTGKSIVVRPCPVCEHPYGFVFQSKEDSNVYLLACKKCKKITIRQKNNNTPIHPTVLACGCGNPLPKGRKKFCYSCRPATNEPVKEVVSKTTAVY